MNLNKFLAYFSLSFELENKEYIKGEIENGIVFRGTNLWILVFAIVVASVGLNTNSTAVIIGAMLISPLMGPINGLGFSVATFDYQLFIKALKNFSFAVGASLVASTLYFILTPVSSAHSELLARTNPTIYDVLIAFFGGLAGIIGISSKKKGNILPGVAIATALMPPLCTAGYGIATGQSKFFFGAFYLFTINTVFIAIATVLTIKLLKFPVNNFLQRRLKTRVNIYLFIVLGLTITPAFYFGFKFVENEKWKASMEQFIQEVTVFDDAYLMKHELDLSNHQVKLIYGGKTLNHKSKNDIYQLALAYNRNTKINIQQGFAFDKNNLSEIDNNQLKINKLSQELALVKKEKDSLLSVSMYGETLLKEIKTLFPEINSCTYFNSKLHQIDSINTIIPINIVYFNLNKKTIINSENQAKIYQWLKQKLNQDSLVVLYQ